MLLKEIANGRCAFGLTAESWEEAVTLSCRPLVEAGCVTEEYAQDVIEIVNELGPYIVILPGLAIPHSSRYPEHTLKTAVSFVNFRSPISFSPGAEDPETQAQLFFALSAVDPEQHLENMKRLFDVLSNEALLDALRTVRSPRELEALEERFSPL